jgi:hypothetical protein
MISALMTAVVLAAVCSSDGLEIPCNRSSSSHPFMPFVVASNQTYTLTNCIFHQPLTQQQQVAPFVYLSTHTSAAVVEHVHIDVVGGDVIPLLTFSASTVTVRNVSVALRGVRMLPYSETRLGDAPPLSMLCMGASASSAFTLQSLSTISMLVENTTIDVTTITSFSSTSSLLVLSVNAQAVGAVVDTVDVVVRSSNLSLRVGGTSSQNKVGLARVIAAYRVSNVAFLVQGSAVRLILDTSLVEVNYNSIKAAFLSIMCPNWQPCFIFNITFVAGADTNLGAGNGNVFAATTTTFILDHSLPGTFSNSSGGDDGVDETAAIVSLSDFIYLDNVTITIHQHTDVALSCRCVSRCDDTRSGGKSSSMRARMLEMSGPKHYAAAISHVALNVSDSIIFVNASKTAVVVSLDTFSELRGLNVIIERCVVVMKSTNLVIGSATRNQALFEISGADNTSGIDVMVRDVDVLCTIQSGGCFLVVSTIVNMLGNISFATVQCRNVTLTVYAVNGTATATVPLIAAVTMVSSLISVGPQDPKWVKPGLMMHVMISNSSLISTHTTDLPMPLFVAMVVSVIAAVNVVRSLTNCSITLVNTHVLRQSPSTNGAATWFPRPGDVHLNATTHVSLLEIVSTVVSASGNHLLLSFLADLLNVPPISHTNVSTIIDGNCTVAYDEQLVPSATDSVAFVNLPTVANRCTYLIQDSWPSRHRATFGAPIGSIGDVLLANSSVTVRRMSGLSMLLFALLQPLVVRGDSVVTFDNITLTARHFGLPMHSYAIGAYKANITVTQSPLRSTALSAVFAVQRCAFTNFAAHVYGHKCDTNGGPGHAA